jgi:hypothetical protein
MTIFDLVFIAAIFTGLVLLIRVLWKLFRRNSQGARRAAIQLGIIGTLYMAVLLTVSISTPQRVLGMREDRCFDDWCIAVDDCSVARNYGKDHYVVGLRVSSRARRVSQRALDAAVYLTDATGVQYYPSPEAQRIYDASHPENKPLSALLGSLDSFSTVRVFDLPLKSTNVGLLAVHGQGPGRFVIGDSESLLHKKTVTKLVCREVDSN